MITAYNNKKASREFAIESEQKILASLSVWYVACEMRRTIYKHFTHWIFKVGRERKTLWPELGMPVSASNM